jgi:hypothetical protein
VGQQRYYVMGWDSLAKAPLASLWGHLGRVVNGQFQELITKTLYFNLSCLLWDLQKTILSYAKAHDDLTGSTLVKEFMDTFDENNDGLIDYDEMGRKGFWNVVPYLAVHGADLGLEGEYGQLQGNFNANANRIKVINKNWNPQGHDFAAEYLLEFIGEVAFALSQSPELRADHFVPKMIFGQGRWPSWQTATYIVFTSAIYGSNSPSSLSLQSLYGLAFQYADKALNGGSYTGSKNPAISDPNSLPNYLRAVSEGAAFLNFRLYVPVGYGSLESVKMPNVEETKDPNKIFTAHFNGGQEVW